MDFRVAFYSIRHSLSSEKNTQNMKEQNELIFGNFHSIAPNRLCTQLILTKRNSFQFFPKKKRKKLQINKYILFIFCFRICWWFVVEVCHMPYTAVYIANKNDIINTLCTIDKGVAVLSLYNFTFYPFSVRFSLSLYFSLNLISIEQINLYKFYIKYKMW